MPQGEFLSGAYITTEEERMQLQVTTVTLGENNIGSFGPNDLDEATRIKLQAANADPQYEGVASNRYICVDGRCCTSELDEVDASTEIDPQIAGGQVVSETAATYMDDQNPQPVSQTVAVKTQEAIADGFRVTVHGANGNKNGCKANEDMRPILHENAANIDIVVPIVQSVNEGLGISDHVTTEDLTAMVVAGKRAADTDELWDAGASEVADIIVANGGEYMDDIGEHFETGLRVSLNNKAYRKAKFTRDMSLPDRVVQQFAASLGKYKEDAFERAARTGQTEREAALLVAKVVLFNVGAAKHLLTPEAPVHLVA